MNKITNKMTNKQFAMWMRDLRHATPEEMLDHLWRRIESQIANGNIVIGDDPPERRGVTRPTRMTITESDCLPVANGTITVE